MSAAPAANHAQLLTLSVMASSLCFYTATVYGILYLMFTTIPTVFGEIYGWDASIAGLAYAPCRFLCSLCSHHSVCSRERWTNGGSWNVC